MKFIKHYIKSKHFDEKIKEFLICFYDINSPHPYENLIKLSREFDERIIDLIIKSLMNEFSNHQMLENQILIVINEISQAYENLFVEINDRYLSTPVKRYPNLDDVLFIAVSRIFKSLQNPLVIPELVLYVQKFLNSEKVYLTPKLIELCLLPEEIQYSYAEIIFSISDPEKSLPILCFIYEKFGEILPYSKIPSEWSEKFISRALQNPYRDILNKYIPTKKDKLLKVLKEVTSRIHLLTTPGRFYGITLKNQSIVIKLFRETSGNEGATFAVYLHELAHFLRRVGCKNIMETNKRKSHEIEAGSEGGYALEEMTFGSRLLSINDDAGVFLLSENFEEILSKKIKKILKKKATENSPVKKFSELPTEEQTIVLHEAFQTEFQYRNKGTSTEHRIYLCRYGGPIMLGFCGSVYGL